jgi:formylglycine-generating enzyme required for sulfatase activity
MKFVKISAGTFQMGTVVGEESLNSLPLKPHAGTSLKEAEEFFREELPQHLVTISRAFYMATTAVTQSQWEAVMGNNPSKFNGTDLPVEEVSWDDAQAFIVRMNKADPGKGYRLPTEAEWEYACRAGSTDISYGDLDAIAWYDGNSGGRTHPVGQKEPNAWGLYDMNGNVDQWCQDHYGETYYDGSPSTDPQGPWGGSYRVIRGGGWNSSASWIRSAARHGDVPGQRYQMGFRLVRTMP